MSNHPQFLRIKKLIGEKIILNAAKHNLRELLTESHIDANRSRMNIILEGATTAANVALTAQSLMDYDLLKPLRRDAVRGLEIVFGLPVKSGIDELKFFRDCVSWSVRFFEVPLISAIIHNDETAPHCHIILLPLFDGRMIGSGLMGNRMRLNTMQTDFHEQVGQVYGLIRQTPSKRIPIAARRDYAVQVIVELKINPSRINEPAVKTALLELLVIDPMAALQSLGLHPATTSEQKRDKPIGFSQNKPIGFSNHKPDIKQSLSCVGFPIPEPDLTPATDDISNEYTRITADDIAPESWDGEGLANIIPDGDYSADSWDSDKGEFNTMNVKSKQVHS